jgi:hypothetical protein
MPSAEYFRRQADICLRLSLIASDEEVSSRLIVMAREYMATVEALAKEAATAGAVSDHPTGPPDPGQDLAAAVAAAAPAGPAGR